MFNLQLIFISTYFTLPKHFGNGKLNKIRPIVANASDF